MLQQTQVATVIPYYDRFLRVFPTVHDLARAPLEQVLKLWSGLGYYRRARSMHAAARQIVEAHGGRFPQGYEAVRALPGVGSYTAAAVLSIAYDQPYAVLDGNVARVVSRLAALRGHYAEADFQARVRRELDMLLSRRRPGNFNQALMELGQTVCLPRAPRCPSCSLRRWCRALRERAQETYPEPRPRRARETRHLAAAVVHRGNRVLMVRGLDEGLLDDLWNFPAAFGATREQAQRRLAARLTALGRPFTLGKPVAELRHNITYRDIQVEIFALPDRRRIGSDAGRWVDLRAVSQGAVSQLARRIAAALR